MVREFEDALDALGKDDEVRIVVITGAGKKFSTGQELQEFKTADEKLRKSLKHLKRPRLLHFEKPVIAAVNGPAISAAQTMFSCAIWSSLRKKHFSLFQGPRWGLSAPTPLPAWELK